MFGLDTLQTYLVIINLFAFAAFSLYFVAYLIRGKSIIHPYILSSFALIGGGAGILCAFLLWDRKVVKDNVAWRFIALGGIVIWALILANVYGPYRFDPRSLASSLTEQHFFLATYLTCINITTLVAFVIDKLRAMNGRWRIREFTLLGLAMLGGALGGILGMIVARHKVNTYYFKYGLPIMLMLNIAVILYLMQTGLV